MFDESPKEIYVEVKYTVQKSSSKDETESVLRYRVETLQTKESKYKKYEERQVLQETSTVARANWIDPTNDVFGLQIGKTNATGESKLGNIKKNLICFNCTSLNNNLAKYKLSNGNNYITYTYNEINDNNMIKIYSTGVIKENDGYSYKEIVTNEEWDEIKAIMKEIARDPNEPLDEAYKCDLKFEGEEVSVRRPKKLLVSKKFADTLASKYSEESKINSIPDLNIEAAVNTPAEFILGSEQSSKEDLLNKEKLIIIKNKLSEIKTQETAEELNVGEITLKDIMQELSKPGRDPREDMPKPALRADVLKFEDLKEGMILTGTVRNVTDFGAFVDVGVKHDGLVHISQLSNSFVKNPSDVVSVGDVVKVKIIGIDEDRKKAQLSMRI